MSDEPLEEIIFFNLERTIRRAKEYTKEVFQSHGFEVTIDQWVVIKRLSEVEQITQIDLANSTFKDPASITRIVDILVKKEYLERRKVEGDRRSYHLVLTSKGSDLVRRMTPIVQEIRKKGLSGISLSNVKNAITVLRKMNANF